jgi:uncharacterized membrane protein YkvA (DUF1232 family)
MEKGNPKGKRGEPSLFQRLKGMSQRLKVETYALSLAYRDPRTPWYAKVWAMLVVAYAFSPIDLIPDFIPVLGYLDDLLFVPFGIWLALKMIPGEVMTDARENAQQLLDPDKRTAKIGAVVIVAIWLLAGAVISFSIYCLIIG